MSDDDELRGHAAQCKRMAEESRSETDKLNWLRLAELWLRKIGKAEPPATNNFS